MKIINICLITIFYGMLNDGFAQTLQIPGPYHWKNRIILLFSKDQDDKLEQQIKVFEEHQDGLKERDLVIFYIQGKEVKSAEGARYDKETAAQLRKQYQVSKDTFSVILIGKDGSQKLRQKELLTTEKLFAVIDAMPMRRQELRDDEKN